MKRGYINIFFFMVLTFSSLHGMEGARKKDNPEAKKEDKSIVLIPEFSEYLLDHELACLKSMKDNPEALHEPSILDYLFGKNKCRFIWALMSNSKLRKSDAYPLMQKLGSVGKKEAEDMLEELFEAIEQRELDDTAYTKIKSLINKGVDLEQEHNCFARTSLHWAAMHQNLPILQLILDQGISPNIRSFRHQTPLWDALYMNCTQKLAECLLEYGLDINAQDVDGNTALHHYFNDLRSMEFLIDHNADVNIKDNSGNTPLHKVAFLDFWNCDKIQIIDCLIKAGADIFAKNSKEETPIDLAKRIRRLAPSIFVYLYLEQEKAKVREKNLNA